MRPILTLLLVIALGSLTAQGWGKNKRITGNGDVVTQDRETRDFDGVSACCSLNVEMRKGGSCSVRIEAESNIQEYIRTDVVGGRLEVGFKNNVNLRNHEKITIYVTLPTLEFVGASSSSKITGKDAFTGEDLEIDASSSGRIELDWTGARVDADASSSGKIYLTGSGNRIKANVSSGANIRASDYSVKRARAGASSGGRVSIKVTEELTADASSGGSVRYNGNPSMIDSDTSSGGSVKREN